MKHLLFAILLISLTFTVANSSQGFRAAGGFCLAVYQPDLGPINASLKSLWMPQMDNTLLLYGAQGFGYVTPHLSIGAIGFGGNARVSDLKGGYAREVSFNIGWGGLLLDYRLLEISHFDVFGGGALGWGTVTIHLQKTHSEPDWDDIWDNYKSSPTESDNISTDMTHSFFLVQPRLGLRYYPLSWMALSGSIELPLLKLNSGGWQVNGDDVYNAPGMNLIAPFFHFSLLFGG